MSKICVGALLALCVSANRLTAEAQPLITDRPDFTESAATVPAGLRQLELGITAERSGGQTHWTTGEALLRLGLAERWELRLEAPSHHAGPGPDGFADGGIGFKLQIAPNAQGARPAMAVIVATSVPSGQAPLRSSAWQPETKLCLAWQPGRNVGLSANVNFARPVEENRRFDQASASLSLALELSSRVGAYVEWFGHSAERPSGASTQAVNLGATLLLGDEFQLDARVGRSLPGETGEFFAGIGASLRF